MSRANSSLARAGDARQQDLGLAAAIAAGRAAAPAGPARALEPSAEAVSRFTTGEANRAIERCVQAGGGEGAPMSAAAGARADLSRAADRKPSGGAAGATGTGIGASAKRKED